MGNDENTLLFEEFDRSDFDALPYPILITDNSGKILFKNKYAYKTKLLKLNMNIKYLFKEGFYEKFLDAAANNNTAILDCIIETGITHACVVSLPNGENIVFLTVCAILLQNITDLSPCDLASELFYKNDAIIKAYENTCKKFKSDIAPQAAEILRYNSLRFSRAAKNMSMYVHTILSTENFENEQNEDLELICQKLVNYFQSKITPLGFRIYIDFDDESFLTKIQKNTFICVFLELCSIALRLSNDLSCNIKMYKSNDRIYVDYRFCTMSKELGFATYSRELDFVRKVTNFCKWEFEDPSEKLDGETKLLFSVPVVIEPSDKFGSPKTAEGFDRDKMIDMCDEIVSSLFFF